MKSSSDKSEILPPQWSSPAPGRRSQLPPVEKSPPAKPKRALKRRQFQAEAEQRQHFMFSDYYSLLRIFQYLEIRELLRAARVCRMWRDLAVQPSLWKTVRMKNIQVTDWDGLAEALTRHGTQHLDLRKISIAAMSNSSMWEQFVSAIPRVTSLVKLELCECPVVVVNEVIRNCPQLEMLSAISIMYNSFLNLKSVSNRSTMQTHLNMESVGNLKRCRELKFNSIRWVSLEGDLSPLQTLTQLTHLSMTAVKWLSKKRIDILESLTNLETLELGDCSNLPEKFGTRVLLKLRNLKRLRLEVISCSCCTFDILEGVSKLENLSQLELVNFDVENGFDKCLANCKNIKRLLIVPHDIYTEATPNDIVLGGVMELSNNLTHFVWCFTLNLVRSMKAIVYHGNERNKQVAGDYILISKSLPCLKYIEEDNSLNGYEELKHSPIGILPLPQLQKILLKALPKARVEILKIPFSATLRQSISDSTEQ